METPDTCSLADLVHPHVGRIIDATGGTAVAAGWRRIATRLLAGWATALRRHPGASVAVLDFTEHAGGLRVAFDPPEGGTLPEHLATDLRRRSDAAELATLQTCDRCGRRGVLRLTEKGDLAVRCEHHADAAGSRKLRRDPVPAEEVVVNLLRSHADWLESEGSFAQLPQGWVGLVVESFAELRKLPTGQGFRLLGMRAVCGRLEVMLEHAFEALDLGQYLAWRTTLLALGDAALFTCDVCGAEARLRRDREGAAAPRCDAHANLMRWPSLQWSAHAKVAEPMVVVTSARGQWDAKALSDLASPAPADPETTQPSAEFALYQISDVAAALGLADDGHDDPFESRPSPADTEHQARLRKLLDRGDAGQWRRLAAPSRDMLDALDAIARRAPHLHELSALVRRHLAAALNIGLPVSLPPLLVLGEPGVGKTWFLTALGRVLGVPFRSHPMSGASHSDGVGGAHPVWRNAQVGLVARALLGEEVANPLLFIDEFDKVPPGQGVDDLYRPYYQLLEPLGARRFVDAYLSFPIDASNVMWVFAANDPRGIPTPILNRLTILTVKTPDAEHLVTIAGSIYAEANQRRLFFFPDEPSATVVERLAGMSPRSMRLAIEHAMTVAAAGGRHEVRAEDLPDVTSRERTRIGFV